MNIYRYIAGASVLCLLILLLQLVTVQPLHAAPRSSTLDVARIDAFVREQVEQQNIPGLALAVVEKNQIVHTQGYGQADETGRPVTAQTPFVLASVSKPITALAIMQLVEVGAIDLDAPVQRYLPTFRVADPLASGQITVRHLLTHTSGVPEAGCTTRTGATGLAEFVAEWQTIELAATPGTQHYYCSGNYNVLGRIIEVVTHRSYGRYIKEEVFKPLEMGHSYTSKQHARNNGLAEGYRLLFGVRELYNYENPSALPAGFLISSVEDMAHFLVAQLNGGRFGGKSVLSPAGIAALHAPGVATGPGRSYGLGWRTGTIGGMSAIFHSGDHPNYHSLLFFQPETGRGAVLLVNMNNIPAALTAFPAIESGVARLLAGGEAAPAPIGLPTLYLIIDVVLGGLFALTLWPLLKLWQWARRIAQLHEAGQLRPLWVGVLLGWEFAAPVALLVVTHQLFSAILGDVSWREILLVLPDLGAWPWAIAAVLLLTGTLRLIVLLRVRQQAMARTVDDRRPTMDGELREVGKTL